MDGRRKQLVTDILIAAAVTAAGCTALMFTGSAIFRLLTKIAAVQGAFRLTFCVSFSLCVFLPMLCRKRFLRYVRRVNAGTDGKAAEEKKDGGSKRKESVPEPTEKSIITKAKIHYLLLFVMSAAALFTALSMGRYVWMPVFLIYGYVFLLAFRIIRVRRVTAGQAPDESGIGEEKAAGGSFFRDCLVLDDRDGSRVLNEILFVFTGFFTAMLLKKAEAEEESAPEDGEN